MGGCGGWGDGAEAGENPALTPHWSWGTLAQGSPLPGLGRDATVGVDLLMECDVSAGRVPALWSQKWEVWQWSLTWSK